MLFALRSQYRAGEIFPATMNESSFEPAMRLIDLPEGRMSACQISGRKILVCHTRDGIFALDNVCTHAYARMTEGRLRGTRLICPLHAACFDVRDGRVLAPPAQQPLATHALRLLDGMIEVAIDPAAAQQVAY
jgi:3-phenylpropionate/trans-cinnamate dioxygenase ferredoxin subunit